MTATLLLCICMTGSPDWLTGCSMDGKQLLRMKLYGIEGQRLAGPPLAAGWSRPFDRLCPCAPADAMPRPETLTPKGFLP